MVKILLKSIQNIQKMTYDVHLVPVSIDYERVFDLQYLSDEILAGAFKPGLSLVEVVKKVAKMRQG